MSEPRTGAGNVAVLGASLLFGVAIIVGGAAPAHACSLVAPIEVREALGEVPPNPAEWREGFRFPTVVSVYEEGPIASVPGIVIKNGETVRGVIRYWGASPPTLGSTTRIGGAWNVSPLRTDDSCDPIDARASRYAVAFEDGSSYTLVDLTAADEELLEGTLGDAVIVDRGVSEVARLVVSLWWPILLALGGLGAAAAAMWRRWRRGRTTLG